MALPEKKLDYLTVYFGEDYPVSEYIKIRQPTVMDIVRFGESRFWNLVTLFCANPSSLKLPLWEVGIDWNDIDDFDLFIILLGQFTKEETSFIFGDLDFRKFRLCELENGEKILISCENPDIIIDKEIHHKIITYLRVAFDYYPKEEKTTSKLAKELMLEDEKIKIQDAERQKKAIADNPLIKEKPAQSSQMLSMISFLLNHAGFKYRKDELDKVGIFEFMDAVKRVQNTEAVQALFHGMYSGFVDTSKIDDENFDFFRDIHNVKSDFEKLVEKHATGS